MFLWGVILGRSAHIHSAAFDEYNRAVTILTQRTVVFNAHSYPAEVPPGAIIYNFENLGVQVDPRRYAGYPVWEFSAAQVAKYPYPVTHVPVGWHPSMKTFERLPPDQRDIDVVFCGSINERRVKVLKEMQGKGLKVAHLFGVYGPERDAVIARSKVALNMFYYEGGVFPALRVAHMVANGVPVVSEACAEGWEFLESVPVERLAAACADIANAQDGDDGSHALKAFQAMPLSLP